MKNSSKNLQGKKFNRWTVLQESHMRKGTLMWHCVCECGTQKIISGYSVLAGESKSCGCLVVDTNRLTNIARRGKNTKPIEHVMVRSLYNRCAGGARKRKYQFNITELEFRELIKQRCFYCNQDPVDIPYRVDTSRVAIRANGVDRVDNAIGYQLDNCVPCCKNCNMAKLTQTTEEFFSWISRTYRHLKSTNKIP